uniref:Peroxisomal ATPase PEX1 n=1 Tax=Lygus hesperus TaxID=30085 RepID=A0A0A9WLA2_LYGHE
MHIEIFKLKLVNAKNDFIHFSAATYNNLAIASVHALKAESQDGSVFYFSPHYSPHGSVEDDCIGISRSYARALALKEDQHLVISTITNLGSIKRLHVSPWTSDDLEIVCSSSSIIESQLLSQLRIVWPNQVFCAWISNNISFNLVVDSFSPELPYGRLEEYTEIVVNMEPKRKVEKFDPPKKPTTLRKYCNEEMDYSSITVQCRCVPIDDSIKLHFKLQRIPPFAVYMPTSFRTASDSCHLWKLVKKDHENSSSEAYVQLFHIENGSFRKSRWTELFLSESVASYLNVKLGAKVDLIPLKDVVLKEEISAMLISPRFNFKNSEEEQQSLIREVRDCLMDYALYTTSVLLNNKGEITLKSGRKVQLTLRPLSIVWSFISIATLREVSFSCNEYYSEGIENPPSYETCNSINIWTSLIENDELKLVDKLARTNGPNAHLQANLLITGRNGSGKTELSKSLMTRLAKAPFYFNQVQVDCLKLKGKRIEVVVRELNETLKDSIDHQPSVVFLENIDAIASLPNADHVGTEATLFVHRIAHKIVEVLVESQRLNSISFVGTALSASKVHPRIYTARGKSLFTTHVQMPENNKEKRKDILKKLILDRAPASDLDDVELDKLASVTEGFLIADLVKLVKTALFEAWQRKVREQVELKIANSDLVFALHCTKPSYLEGIDLLKEKKHSWATVGGLKEAKAKITEVIIWPTLYPHVLKQCPLKAQTGILVYGAPGTGKTILARAAAFESSLNFITVKGPELMSKYIGQSEEGVRNVFEKAQSAKPCLLFFDEFESLAPRRGKDQTGVTDRVVNQLLTALDGVEPLTGVFVMAATSRPDLIDPALLRPGRIGTSVHCSFPDTAARAEILSALSSGVELDDDVDFSIIAEATQGFSGADLKGVLSAAQLRVMDLIISDYSSDGHQSEETLPLIVERHKNVKLKQHHILDALKDCKPSLGPGEKRKYDNIYNNFLKPSFVDMKDQKVTFA